jgi:hypothetical protein
MRCFALTIVILLFNAACANGSVLFDFDGAPLHAPLPIDLTSDGITAHLSSTGQGYSIQQADTLGFTPVGFAGYCVYPSSVFPADLLVSFDHPLTDFSMLYAPEEYATDSSCTMRVTAHLGTSLVGTQTHTNPNAGTWPTDTLAIAAAQPFDNVIVHYEHAPITGGDYGPIFMADNMIVTPAPVPEPASVAACLGSVGLILHWRRRRGG